MAIEELKNQGPGVRVGVGILALPHLLNKTERVAEPRRAACSYLQQPLL